MDPEIRMLLLKVNVRDNFDQNFKRINAFKLTEKVKALVFLLGKENEEKPSEFIKKLKSEGVTLALLRILHCLFEHNCSSCNMWIDQNRHQEVPEVACIGCGMRACANCHKHYAHMTHSTPKVCPNGFFN